MNVEDVLVQGRWGTRTSCSPKTMGLRGHHEPQEASLAFGVENPCQAARDRPAETPAALGDLQAAGGRFR